MAIVDMCDGLWCRAWAWRRTMAVERRERGSVTVENVIWALAVIAIAGIVVAAITSYVGGKAAEIERLGEGG